MFEGQHKVAEAHEMVWCCISVPVVNDAALALPRHQRLKPSDNIGRMCWMAQQSWRMLGTLFTRDSRLGDCQGD